MNKEQWLWQFDESKNKFQWFWLQYGFEKDWILLMEARKRNQIKRMRDIMNNVWFALPDEIFNIMVNPSGWSAFIELLED